MKEDTAEQIVRSKAERFLCSIARDLRNHDHIRKAAAKMADEIRMAALEREHFGDPDKETGIYSLREPAASDPLRRFVWEVWMQTHNPDDLPELAVKALRGAGIAGTFADKTGTFADPELLAAHGLMASDGWSSDQPNADGRWLWREGGKEHREVELVLCGDGAEVADPDDDTQESSQTYWCRTPTNQQSMPGLWKRDADVQESANATSPDAR